MAHLRWRSPSTFPADGSLSPHTRPFWPWLAFAVLVVVGITAMTWLLRPPPVIPEPRPMSAEEANAVLGIVQLEMTAAARRDAAIAQATPTGPMEVYVVGIAPTPTSVPVPTSTPHPVCPQPAGTVCKWPQSPAEVRLRPTSTPYPVCATPDPFNICRMPEATPDAVATMLAQPTMTAAEIEAFWAQTPAPVSTDCTIAFGGILVCTPVPAATPTIEAQCWPAGWSRVCWPAGCRALTAEWC